MPRGSTLDSLQWQNERATQTPAPFVLLPSGHFKRAQFKKNRGIKKSCEMGCFYLSMHTDYITSVESIYRDDATLVELIIIHRSLEQTHSEHGNMEVRRFSNYAVKDEVLFVKWESSSFTRQTLIFCRFEWWLKNVQFHLLDISFYGQNVSATENIRFLKHLNYLLMRAELNTRIWSSTLLEMLFYLAR